MIIAQLRSHQTVQAEFFDSITILFSDIPVFGEIVSRCELLDVIGFLNQTHTAFDKTVHEFDGYKYFSSHYCAVHENLRQKLIAAVGESVAWILKTLYLCNIFESNMCTVTKCLPVHSR